MKTFFRKFFAGITIFAILFSFSGCGSKPVEKKEPVTISVWHVYGGQTDSPLNTLIGEFNRTVGAENNIYVQVTSVSNTNTIHEDVLAAAHDDPGAPVLPDLFISYPKTVMALPDNNILVDYKDYFTEEELAQYIPSFIEEGTVDDRLLVFPVAKSTEIMFINKTAFDRFSAETGITMDKLDTWEGLFETAEIYSEWTDAKTPDIPDDGKSMFVHDYYFNYFQVGEESLGDKFFTEDEKINFDENFDKCWNELAHAAINGGVWLKGGYATESLRTGDSIVSVASSASVLYYQDIVTYPDNTSEDIEIIARPCPVFEGGENLVMQRGAGFCTVKSTPEREKAAIMFLKWLTEPEKNVEFVTQVGYMPVTQKSFEEYLPDAIEGITSPKYKELYKAFIETQEKFTFYTPPQLEGYLAMETDLESGVRQQLSIAKREFLEQKNTAENQEELLNRLIESSKNNFVVGMR